MSKMEKEIIKAIKNSGISDKQIQKELSAAKEAFGGFVKNPETLAILLANDHGIPIDAPKKLGTFRSAPEKMDISDISSGMLDKNITTSGFIIQKKKGKTKSGNPKVTLTITNGISTIIVSVFDEAYNTYKALKFDVFDKIRFTGAKIFEFKSDRNDDMIVMLTAGRFTTIEKLNKDIKKVMTEYKEADVGTIAIVYGIVTETNENSYYGCPDCQKKGDAKDGETEFECDCGYSGLPKEYIITNAIVTDGEENIVVTLFPRLGVRAKDISLKPIIAVGKKSDDKLTATAIKAYDMNNIPKKFSEDNEDDEDNEETSEGEVEYTDKESEEEDEEKKPKSKKPKAKKPKEKEEEEEEEAEEDDEEDDEDIKPKSNNKKLGSKIKDQLEMFPSGIAKSGLVEIIKAKEKVKRSKILAEIESLKDKGELEEDDDENIKLSD